MFVELFLFSFRDIFRMLTFLLFFNFHIRLVKYTFFGSPLSFNCSLSLFKPGRGKFGMNFFIFNIFDESYPLFFNKEIGAKIVLQV
jgi:hypothetical protein